jgi:hypothetical protein
MFYLSWLYGLIGTIILLVVFVYLVIMAPARNWGDVTQAIMFHQVRKYLLLLDSQGQHSKFWRPNVLLLVDNPAVGLVAFCNNVKKGGLLLVSQAVIGKFGHELAITKSLKVAWNSFLKQYKIKGFSQFTIEARYQNAVQSLLLGAGLGGMNTNTLCLPLLSTKPNFHPHDQSAKHENMVAFLSEAPSADSHEHDDLVNRCHDLPVSSFSEYCGLLHDALQFEHNVFVACNFAGGLPLYKDVAKAAFTSPKKYTDIWIIGDFALVGDPAGTLHSLWGYTSSPCSAHIAHPFLTIPPPLEAGDGVFDPATLDAPTGMAGLSPFLVQLGAIADQTRVGLDGKRLPKGSHSFRIIHVPSSAAGAIDAASQRTLAVDFIKQLCVRSRFIVDEHDILVFMLLGLLTLVNFSSLLLSSLI